MDAQGICRLAAGDVAGFRGVTLNFEQLPACLGPRLHKGASGFPLGATLASATYRVAASEVVVYWWMNDGRIGLIDSRFAAPRESSTVSAGLPAAETVFRYSEEELAGWDLSPPPGGSLEEHVHGSRGLSLLVARDATGKTRVVRVRGFAPMPAARYLSDYVRFRLEPIE